MKYSSDIKIKPWKYYPLSYYRQTVAKWREFKTSADGLKIKTSADGDLITSAARQTVPKLHDFIASANYREIEILYQFH
jgi:hypothetical protein